MMNNGHEVEAMAKRIRTALASPITSDNVLDPHKDLAEILLSVGLKPFDCGGSITFEGKDPILKSPWPLATMAAGGLMAKELSIAGTLPKRDGHRPEPFSSLPVSPPHPLPLFDTET